MRILYLAPGPTPPPKDPQKNMFYHLSRHFNGDILAPIWGKKNKSSAEFIKEISKASGNFQYHVTFSSQLPNLVKLFWDINFYLLKGLYLHYFKKEYDVIITYGPFKTGLAGYLLKKLTGAKLVIQVPGNPKKSFLFELERISITDYLKSKVSDLLVPALINRADHLKLLYPGQLDDYKTIKKDRVDYFHDFVAINKIKPSDLSEKYILFLGFPWFLKGVDILIKAFKLISNDFPEYRLKIVGHCPDKTYFQKLAEGNDKIELSNAVYHDQAIKLMSACSLFVLPSRTEGLSRVLIEAMAAKKAIIASNADGNPHCIKHNFNGLIFESGNVEDLAEKMRALLKDQGLAERLAKNGHEHVYNRFSEDVYVDCYKEMVEKVLESSQ